jgi:cardiolipin synthase
MRSCLCLVLAAVLSGCATLPEVHPWFEPDTGTKSPKVVGARGAVSQETAETILARLKEKGGGDVLERHVIVEEAVARSPLTVGNAATLLQDGPATYKSMFGAIERARDHVNIEFYMIEQGETGNRFAELLLKKRGQGVAVNLIYDAVGSLDTPPEYFKRLRDAGVRVLEYNPVNPLKARTGWRVNNRNHTKLVIVDGSVAFTGGINISDVYSSGSSPGSSGGSSGGAAAASGGFSSSRPSRPGRDGDVGWRDVNVRIEGPAVAQLQRQFLDTWASQKGEPLAERNWFPALRAQGEHPVRVVSSGPGDPAPAIYVALVSAIAHAEKTIHITMAYFVPDSQTVDALKAAAARGVEVVLVLPSYTDFWAVFHAGRSYYTDLLEAGVKIYERQNALLHSKTVVIDGVWSTVGSSNLDWRSFLHNKELNLVILGREFGRQMEAMFEVDRKQSVQIEREAWARRPLDVRMKEWMARLWGYWL